MILCAPAPPRRRRVECAGEAFLEASGKLSSQNRKGLGFIRFIGFRGKMDMAAVQGCCCGGLHPAIRFCSGVKRVDFLPPCTG